ncbi:MAG: hypothetical protein R3C31_01520 [Hyphomonadaceae bacterium]
MTADRFAQIFVEEFHARAEREGERFGSMWHAGGAPWTALMVHDLNQDSVLACTLKRWAHSQNQDISMHHWYTIDLMAVTPPFKAVADYWDTRPLALIEHENAKDVETEAWKLAHWRAPLKVLVFYRFNHDDAWLDDKFATIKQIVEGAQSAHPELGSEYLLMAGCRIKNEVVWRAWTLNDTWSLADYATNVSVA